MHLLYCDETNLDKRLGDFLIYGGMVVEGATAKDFSVEIDNLRLRHRVPRDYRLKFNPGPSGFSHLEFVALKRDIFQIAHQFGARLIVYLTLHDIAVDPDEARRFGINAVCYNFDFILKRFGGSGLVLIDRFNDAGNAIDAHLRDKFTVGVTGMPYTSEMRLANIVGFHYSCVGQSHFPSLVDVVLGSLRFAVNAHTRRQTEYLGTAAELLQLLGPLFWRPDGQGVVPKLGFTFSPQVIRAEKYLKKYNDLKEFLERNGVSIGHEVGSTLASWS
ncbi:hypothetical protein HNP73_000243 [Amaricoccus macauensis]|uniref:DUF3800 domain-containing protein n=1 Tax=Amaricoccus macauensis TaxID=57001 RepID=A0A840SLU5_9RHOB|nr:hypothetical protein [Amaricoccus macauensis]